MRLGTVQREVIGGFGGTIARGGFVGGTSTLAARPVTTVAAPTTTTVAAPTTSYARPATIAAPRTTTTAIAPAPVVTAAPVVSAPVVAPTPYQERLPTGVVTMPNEMKISWKDDGKTESETFQINGQVKWKYHDKDLPKHTVGTVIGFTDKDDDGDIRVRVKFPNDFWDLKAEHCKKVKPEDQVVAPQYVMPQPAVEYVDQMGYIVQQPGVQYVEEYVGAPGVVEYIGGAPVEYVAAPTVVEGGLIYEGGVPLVAETFVTPTYYGEPVVAPTYYGEQVLVEPGVTMLG